MSKVYAPGCWDLLHVGHTRFLEQAKEHGSRLIVGCPTDTVIEQDKGFKPVIPLAERREMLESIRWVDEIWIYDQLDFLGHIGSLDKGDFFIVGSQWGKPVKAKRHYDAEVACREKGIQIREVPYTNSVSTTRIRETVIQRWISSAFRYFEGEVRSQLERIDG